MFAQAGLLGLDVERMLNGSRLDFRLRARIAERAAVMRRMLDDSLAVAIINRLAESMNKGQSGS